MDTARWLRRQAVRYGVFPVVARTVRAGAWREYRRLRALEHEPPDSRQARQAARLGTLIDWVYETVPAYRRTFDAAGVRPADVRLPEHLSRVPIVTKRDIQASQADFISTRARPADLIPKGTSGTTGEPLQVYRDRRAEAFGQATWWQALAWAGASPADPLVYATAARRKGEEDRQTLWSRLVGAGILTYHPEAPYDPDGMLRALAPAHGGVLALFPSFLHLVAQGLVAAGHARVIRPRCIFSFGEHLDDSTRALVDRAFGAPVFIRYGAMEFSSMIAQTCTHDGWHLQAEGFVVEIVDGAPGDRQGRPADRGRIVITDLRNYVMPFIRYEIGDIGAWGDREPCACGRTVPRLGVLEGRVVEYVVTPSGRQVPASMFPRALRPLSFALWEYQLRQDHPSAVELAVVPRDTTDGAALVRALAARVEEFLNHEVAVTVRVVDGIPREASGKRPLLKSTVGGYRPDGVA